MACVKRKALRQIPSAPAIQMIVATPRLLAEGKKPHDNEQSGSPSDKKTS